MRLLNRYSPPSFYLFLAGALLYLAFILLRLAYFNFDVSSFVLAGDRFADSTQVAENLTVIKNSSGYDGQYLYRLALSPLTSEQTAHGIKLDNPRYRQQRIVFPTLVWLFSGGGQAVFVPYIFLIINYLALIFLAFAAFKLAAQAEQNMCWAFLLIFFPGFLLSISRNLAEVLNMAFVLNALYFMHRKKNFLAAGLLALAVLTRETSLFIPFSFFLLHFLFRKKEISRQLFLVPFAAFVAWQIVLIYLWGLPAFFAGTKSFGLPFEAFFRFAMQVLQFHRKVDIIYFSELIFILTGTFISLYLIVNKPIKLFYKISFLLYFLLYFSTNQRIWLEDYGFLRVLPEYFIVVALLVFSAPLWAKRLYLLLTFTVWILLFLFRIQTL